MIAGIHISQSSIGNGGTKTFLQFLDFGWVFDNLGFRWTFYRLDFKSRIIVGGTRSFPLKTKPENELDYIS